MNKGQWVDEVASKSQASITKKQVEIILSLGIASIMDAVAAGDKVTLVGFGTFEARDRAERQGRNPQTGEIVTIPATKAVKFSAGKVLKDLVQGN